MKAIIALTSIIGGICALAAPSDTILRKSPELAFTVPGEGQKLLSQYRGQTIALEFISTSCPHCQAASKVMNRMQEQYRSKGFQALDIAVNPNADLLVENFAKDFQLKFPVGYAPIEQMMSYMGFTERPLVPQLILIDRNGMIHYQTPREGDSQSMREEILNTRIQELLAIPNGALRKVSRTAGRRPPTSPASDQVRAKP